ncbi:MAG: DUF177 domain-containing protein [Mariprofundus sp.]|nr:DUF177 domain-containing protein [Mariprofundus sp.]
MQKQWLMTLQGVTSSGRSWDVTIPAAALGDKERGQVAAIPDLVRDLTWVGELQRKGNVFHLCGEWKTAVRRECSRCTAKFDWQFSALMERDFQLAGESRYADSDAEASEGVCESLPAPGALDLLDLLKEDIWLVWKADVICAEECKGLCLGCGCNLNTEVCSCVVDDSNSPFAALRKLKVDG